VAENCSVADDEIIKFGKLPAENAAVVSSVKMASVTAFVASDACPCFCQFEPLVSVSVGLPSAVTLRTHRTRSPLAITVLTEKAVIPFGHDKELVVVLTPVPRRTSVGKAT
jgi:hypothetical protein